MRTELRHLRYFIKAAEMLHFTRAAEALSISQPSLSHHISQLEEELKTDLFARIGRQVKLTESGEILLRQARKAIQELNMARTDIDSLTGLLRGELAVGTSHLFGSNFLPKAISVFTDRYPNVELHIHTLRAEEVEDGVVSGKFDLGFSILPKEHADLQQLPLLVEDMALILSVDHPLATKPEITVEDLAAMSFVLSGHKVTARPVMVVLDKLHVVPKMIVEGNDGHTLLQLVKLGVFATILQPSLCLRNNTGLCARTLPTDAHLEIGAVWSHLSPAAKAFLDVVIEEDKLAPRAKVSDPI